MTVPSPAVPSLTPAEFAENLACYVEDTLATLPAEQRREVLTRLRATIDGWLGDAPAVMKLIRTAVATVAARGGYPVGELEKRDKIFFCQMVYPGKGGLAVHRFISLRTRDERVARQRYDTIVAENPVPQAAGDDWWQQP